MCRQRAVQPEFSKPRRHRRLARGNPFALFRILALFRVLILILADARMQRHHVCLGVVFERHAVSVSDQAVVRTAAYAQGQPHFLSARIGYIAAGNGRRVIIQIVARLIGYLLDEGLEVFTSCLFPSRMLWRTLTWNGILPFLRLDTIVSNVGLPPRR